MSLSVANICCFLPTNLISDNLGITLSNLRSFAEIEHIGSWQSLFSSVTIRHFETTAIQYSWLNKKKQNLLFICYVLMKCVCIILLILQKNIVKTVFL